MSEEVIPPSDDEVFISTQIQGKLDEIEEEAKVSLLFQKFANEPENPVPKPTKQSKKDSAKPKTKPKLKRKPKKLSVTDQMIRKLSGKPQKFKQMQLKDNIQRGGIRSKTPSFEQESENAYDGVFTSKEWTKLRYVFNVGRDYKTANGTGNLNLEDEQHAGLWDAACDCPEFNVDDWRGLYGYQDRCKVSTIESGFLPPITFSQACRSSQKSVKLHEYRAREEDLSEISRKCDNDGIIDLSASFGDEVVCSSDEGSILELMTKHRGTDESPIVLCSQESDDIPEVFPTPNSVEVKYKGPVKINRDSQQSARLRTRPKPDEEIVPNSSDDEGDESNFIEIVRHANNSVLQVPSSPGYECDDEAE